MADGSRKPKRPFAALTHDDAVILQARCINLRCWARSRIDHCRSEEEKHRPTRIIAFETERRALEAVLRLLDGEEP